jgi:hypothetical protein
MRSRSQARKAQRKAEHLTLARTARAYHQRAIEPAMNAKYSEVRIRSLECHVPCAIWDKPISKVGACSHAHTLTLFGCLIGCAIPNARQSTACAASFSTWAGRTTVALHARM